MLENFQKKIESGFSDDIIESEVLKMMKRGTTWKFSPTFQPKCGHPPVINKRGQCAFCTVMSNLDLKLQQKISETEYLLEGLRRQKAMHDVGVYMEQSDRPGILATLGVITGGALPGKCSARAKAIAAGERWYTPDTPCRHCGTLAPRYVANGMCKGCK